MKRRIILPLLFFILITNLIAQPSTPAFIKDSLDSYIGNALKTWDIPGLAVCIVKDGSLVLMKGYGIREKDKSDKVDENTLFMIGSNSKAFTGTAMVLLEKEGKCSLEDKVRKYLPDFLMKDPWVAKNLNLTDIISHRIGMGTFQGDFIYWTSDLSEKEVIEKFGQLTPMYDFRTKYGYTNAGFAIAGECIKKMTGKTWQEYVSENILKPLKMNNTVLLSEDLPKQGNIAKPHTFVNEVMTPIEFPKIDNLAPAGSISSSVSDLSHWLIAQLGQGKYEGTTVIPFSVIQKTRRPNTIVGSSSNPFDRNPFNLYGLGWFIEDYKGRELVSHTGGVDGFVTSVTLLPSENLGVVVLTNTDANGFYQALKWEIIDSYLNLPYKNYSRKIFENYSKTKTGEDQKIRMLRDTVNMHLKSSRDLKDYTGRYIHEVYGYIDVSIEGNDLQLKFQHHPDMIGKLESLGSDRFLCTYSNPTFGVNVIPFHSDNGRITSFTLKVADFVDYAKYEFIKQ